MWAQLEEEAPRLDQWVHLDQDFYYDGRSTPAGESDSTAESLLTTPSPPFNIRDLLTDSEDYEFSMQYASSYHDGGLFLDNSLDAFNDAPHVGGGSRHLQSAPGRHETGRVGSVMNSRRQRRVQRHDPYPRPSQGPSAPHSDQLDVDTRDLYDTSSARAVRRPLLSGDGHPDSRLNTFALAQNTPSPPPPGQLALHPSAFHRDLKRLDAGDYLRNELHLPLGAPVNLWSVPDTLDGSRPGISLPHLAQLAIHGSENQMLTLQGILQAIKDRFRFYNDPENKPWKNSIRHTLSLHSVFVRVQRPSHHDGKGAYWTLDTAHGHEYKRERKRQAVASGSRRQTSRKAPPQTSSASWPVSSPLASEDRQPRRFLTPNETYINDVSDFPDWEQGNSDPALRDVPSSSRSSPPPALSGHGDSVTLVRSQRQAVATAAADGPGPRVSRRLRDRSGGSPHGYESPLNSSYAEKVSTKNGRRSRA